MVSNLNISTMRKIYLIISIVVFAVAANAQTYSGTITDTLKGDNNVNFTDIAVTGTYENMAIEVALTKISSAAGGTLYLRGGIDSLSVLNESTSNAKFTVNDTLTVTDGGVWFIDVPNPAGTKYDILGDGDANDTVKVVIKYSLKK